DRQAAGEPDAGGDAVADGAQQHAGDDRAERDALHVGPRVRLPAERDHVGERDRLPEREREQQRRDRDPPRHGARDRKVGQIHGALPAGTRATGWGDENSATAAAYLLKALRTSSSDCTIRTIQRGAWSSTLSSSTATGSAV